MSTFHFQCHRAIGCVKARDRCDDCLGDDQAVFNTHAAPGGTDTARALQRLCRRERICVHFEIVAFAYLPDSRETHFEQAGGVREALCKFAIAPGEIQLTYIDRGRQYVLAYFEPSEDRGVRLYRNKTQGGRIPVEDEIALGDVFKIRHAEVDAGGILLIGVYPAHEEVVAHRVDDTDLGRYRGQSDIVAIGLAAHGIGGNGKIWDDPNLFTVVHGTQIAGGIADHLEAGLEDRRFIGERHGGDPAPLQGKKSSVLCAIHLKAVQSQPGEG